MCFEIIELRDLKCDLFQAFLAKFSQTKNSKKVKRKTYEVEPEN